MFQMCRNWTICFCVFFSFACANVKYTLIDEHEDEQSVQEKKQMKHSKKSGQDNVVQVEYIGTAEGAALLVNAGTKRSASVSGSKALLSLAEKGYPINMTLDSNGSSQFSNGFGMNPFGYGAMGNPMMGYGYGVPVYSQDFLLANTVSQQVIPQSLPMIQETTSLENETKVPCPKNRKPNTTQERLACLENDRSMLAKKVFAGGK